MKRKARLPALDQMVAASVLLIKGEERKALAMLHKAVNNKSIVAALKIIADANDESLDLELEEDSSYDDLELANNDDLIDFDSEDYEDDSEEFFSEEDSDIQEASFKLNRRSRKILASQDEYEDEDEDEDEDEYADEEIDALLASIDSDEDESDDTFSEQDSDEEIASVRNLAQRNRRLLRK